jgi:hypothetical protein
MVHFPGLARTRLWIQRAVSRVHRDGFPHSDIPGSKRACHFPRLIAACHVLHRLLAPRHPPYALRSLTIKLTQLVSFASQRSKKPSRGRRNRSREPELRSGLDKFALFPPSSRRRAFHIRSSRAEFADKRNECSRSLPSEVRTIAFLPADSVVKDRWPRVRDAPFQTGRSKPRAK